MIRRGRNTSEFFITLLAGLGVVAGAVAQVIPPGTAGTLGTIAAVAYVISRGIAKLNNPTLAKAEENDQGVVNDLKVAAKALENVIAQRRSTKREDQDTGPGAAQGPLPPATS